MASTYTVNLGIEKIGTGEQSGTWGTTTNTNFDILDQAINGAATVTLASAGSSGSPNTLAITNGAASDGRNKFIDFADGGDLGATAYVQLTPNDAEKLVHIRNSLSGGRSVIIFQGTYNASNDFEIPNGKDVVLKFDGGGASATVTQVFEDLLVTNLAATTVDSTNLEVTNLKAKDGTAAGSIADSTGVVTLASSVLTTTDINGGTIDGATIATSDITVGSGKTLDVSAGTFTVANDQISGDAINGGTATPTTLTSTTVNATTVDTTNIELTNLKAKDGTAAGSIADSTGVVTLASSVLTTTDINGGTIDGATIGGASAAAGTFTSLNATGGGALTGTWTDLGSVTTVDINGGTIDGVTIGGSSAGAITGTTITGTSFVSSGDMTFGDNDKAIFGAGSDLQIYHDGSNSYISDTGTGSLLLSGSAQILLQAAGTGESLAAFVKDGGAYLYHNNAQKLETTATGIDVTGTVTADGLTVDAAVSNLQKTGGNTILRFTKHPGTQDAVAEIETARAELSGSNSQIYLNTNDGTSTKRRLRLEDNGDISFYEDTGTTPKFFWDASAESLGIGTTSPATPLEVLSSVSVPLTVTRTTSTGSVGIRFSNASGQRGVIYGEGGGGLLFYNQSSEAMRINSSGNVGIGTTSPSSILSGSNTNLTVQGTDGADVSFKRTGGTASFAVGVTSSDTAYVYASSAIPILFGTNSAERMRIDSSGNVGIGVTPSAWSGIGKTLQINTGGSISADTANTYFATNAYYNGTNWIYNTSNYSTRYTSGAGQHQWYTAGSGTAGNAISFTQAMTLDASGNLLVGTTATNSMSGDTLIKFGSGGIISKSVDDVANNGTVDITVASAGGFQGFLAVANTVSANANARTHTTYSVFGRGTDASIQQIATDNGSTSGASFTVTVPSNGTIRVTNTSGNTTDVYIQFFGGQST